MSLSSQILQQSAAPIQDDGSVKKEPKIPRAAFIGGLSALAFTTGITVAMIPALRRNRQRSLATAAQATRFTPNHVLATRPTQPPRSTSTVPIPTSSDSVDSAASSPHIPQQPRKTMLLSDIPLNDTPSPTRYKGPEAVLYGDEADEHTGVNGEDDPAAAISPLFALKAFTIATAVVVGTAAVGTVVIARVLGVHDMDEFSARLRQLTTRSLPALPNAIYAPPPTETAEQMAKQEAFERGRESEDDGVVGEWGRWVGEEVEKERMEILNARDRGTWKA